MCLAQAQLVYSTGSGSLTSDSRPDAHQPNTSGNWGTCSACVSGSSYAPIRNGGPPLDAAFPQ